MVNSPSDLDVERRERPRASAEHASALGAPPNLNPFGDLVTLQHLSARLARALKGIFEPVLRDELRCWAEPLVVQRWGDYRAELGQNMMAWMPLIMGTAKLRALLVIDGALVLQMLDSYFGGDGDMPHPLPTEFSPAAEALVARLAQAMVSPLETAWEPVARVGFRPAAPDTVAAPPEVDAGEAMIVTRFGLARSNGKQVHFDLVYPVAALKPHGSALTAKVQGKSAEVEPQWRNGLTRAVMSVRLPVRSVLAEPVLALGQLLSLKVGDVIPIDFGQQVPVFVAGQRLGQGQAGTANGRAAVRVTTIEPINVGDYQ